VGVGAVYARAALSVEGEPVLELRPPGLKVYVLASGFSILGGMGIKPNPQMGF